MTLSKLNLRRLLWLAVVVAIGLALIAYMRSPAFLRHAIAERNLHLTRFAVQQCASCSPADMEPHALDPKSQMFTAYVLGDFIQYRPHHTETVALIILHRGLTKDRPDRLINVLNLGRIDSRRLSQETRAEVISQLLGLLDDPDEEMRQTAATSLISFARQLSLTEFTGVEQQINDDVSLENELREAITLEFAKRDRDEAN